MPDYAGQISQVQLPGGLYEIKDAAARTALSGAIKIVGKAKITTPLQLTDGCDTNPVTLDDGSSAGKSYTAVANDAVIQGNKEFVFDGTNWHEFGDLTGLGNMAYADTASGSYTPAGSNAASSVSFSGGTTATVLGKNTTFTGASSSVSFSGGTTATVPTTDVTATVPGYAATIKYLKASHSGTTVGANGTAAVVTGYPDATSDTFVKSYPGATSKLVTTTIYGVGSSTTTASKATAGTAVSVAKAGTAVSVASGSLGTETTTQGANTVMWGASVEGETLSFSWKPLSTKSVTPAASNGTITPYTFNDVTVPVKNSSSTTVATGSLNATGSGATVMTGLGTASTATALTGLGTAATATALTGVKVTAQGSVTLSSAATTSTGAVKYTENIATSGTNAVTFDTTGTKSATVVKTIGTATAAGQTVTAGTNDQHTVVKTIGTATAAGQTFSGTAATITVSPNPKT